MLRAENGSSFEAAVKRSRWSDRDAEVVLSAWQEAGGSLSAFARKHGVDAWRLMRWRRRLSKGSGIQFRRVKVVRPQADALRSRGEGGVEVVLRGGRRVVVRRGFDPTFLAEVVQAVESWAC
jgi:transposase-like protein